MLDGVSGQAEDGEGHRSGEQGISRSNLKALQDSTNGSNKWLK